LRVNFFRTVPCVIEAQLSKKAHNIEIFRCFDLLAEVFGITGQLDFQNQDFAKTFLKCRAQSIYLPYDLVGFILSLVEELGCLFSFYHEL
jgi:hypothetical protein